MGTIAHNILYRTMSGRRLYLHVFEPVERPAVSRPAIVFFFGGGWNAGTPSQFYPQSRYLAERGMVAICAEYRVRSRDGVTPWDCVTDAQAAMRYVRAHAADLGIDPNRIAAGGGSAGGHLAACTGILPACTGILPEPLEDNADASISCQANAMVLFNPAVDMDNTVVVQLLGRSMPEISPQHHVRADLPPTIIFHGQADTVVPIVTVERFTESMVAAGNRCELLAFPNKAHGFFNQGREPDDASYLATVQAMDQFLQSLGWLDTPIEG